MHALRTHVFARFAPTLHARSVLISKIFLRRSSGGRFIKSALLVGCADVCSGAYHVCQEVDGELVDTPMDCPEGLVYDMDEDECDYPDNVEVGPQLGQPDGTFKLEFSINWSLA